MPFSFSIFRQLVFILFFPLCVSAQMHQELGVAGGVANYYGTLQPSFFPGYGYKPMGGIIYKYFMDPHIGLRTGLSYTNLTAADSLSTSGASKARNLSFATHLIEFHAALEVNFRAIEIGKKHFTPYIFGGLALFYYDPYAIDPMGTKVYLRPLSTEGEGLPMYPDRRPYSLVNMSFPFGGGFKFFIHQRVILGFELGCRYTNTGYLDDVSKSYVNLDTLQAYRGLLPKQMSYRGNTAKGWNGTWPNYGDTRGVNDANDWYWYGNVTITIFFREWGGKTTPGITDCPRLFR